MLKKVITDKFISIKLYAWNKNNISIIKKGNVKKDWKFDMNKKHLFFVADMNTDSVHN